MPKIYEVQRIQTQTSIGSSLSGSFVLEYEAGENQTFKSTNIAFNSSSGDFKAALEAIEPITQVNVSITDCVAHHGCTWDVTFTETSDDIKMLVPITNNLLGSSSKVIVSEVIKGSQVESINGFPVTIEVKPHVTSPDWTTAYGKGLVSAIAGKSAWFQVQAKDIFGNNQVSTEDLFTVLVYPEEFSEYHPVIFGNVTPLTHGIYEVDYTPQKSGYHTIAVVLTTSYETQVITTQYNTTYRSGTFSLSLEDKVTRPLSWDASASDMKHAIESFLKLSYVELEKEPLGALNYRYSIKFKSSYGNIPNVIIDTSNLIGNSAPWTVISSDGKFSHIKKWVQIHLMQMQLQNQISKQRYNQYLLILITMLRKFLHLKSLTWDRQVRQ